MMTKGKTMPLVLSRGLPKLFFTIYSLKFVKCGHLRFLTDENGLVKEYTENDKLEILVYELQTTNI